LAIAVILELTAKITLGDLKHFLSLAPDDMTDAGEILCLPETKGGAPACLAIPMPAPVLDYHKADESPIDSPGTP
jgi:hypothetical protein